MSEQTPPVPLIDPLEEVIQILEGLPTLQAMKDIQRNRLSGDVRRVVEVMALRKLDLMGAILLQSKRLHAMEKLLGAHYNLAELEKHTAIDWAKAKIVIE